MRTKNKESRERPILFPTQRDHLQILSERLCESDREELSASGMTPLEELTESFDKSSRCWSGFYKGRLKAVFGVGSYDSGHPERGSPWFLSTGDHQPYLRDFLRLSRAIIPDMYEDYTSLMNFVHDKNKRSRRWLEWLGFVPLFTVENYLDSGKDFICYYHFREWLPQKKGYM